MKRRWPLLVFIGVGLVTWQTGAFGFFPTQRSVVWRFPASYSEVRGVELQVWDETELLHAEQRSVVAGLTDEPTLEIALRGGPHRAIAMITLRDGSRRGFQKTFDPASDRSVVIDFK